MDLRKCVLFCDGTATFYELLIFLASFVLILLVLPASSQTDGDPELVLQEDVSGVCINMVGLVLACSVFLVAQLVIIVAWTAVWHRRRRSKLEEPLSPATTTESLRQLYDSGYPRRI